MALVVKRAGAEEYGRSVKMLLTGDPGAGKTRLSSTAPNVLYANIEGGLMSVVDRQPAFVDIDRSEDMAALRLALSQSPDNRRKFFGYDIDTVCVDTIDNLQRMLVSERLEDQKKEAMAMADWGWLGDQLRGIIRSFRNLDMHVIFTCHIKTVEDSETQRAYVKPALQGAMQDEIAAYVDLAVLLRAQPVTRVVDGETKRVLARTMQTFPDINHPWLKDRSGRLPMEFAVNLDDDFTRIINAIFAEKAVPSEVTGEIGGGVDEVKTLTAPLAKKAAAAKKAAPKAAEKVSQTAGQADAPPAVVDEAPEVPPVVEPEGEPPAAPPVEAPAEPTPAAVEEAPSAPAETDDGRVRCENPDCESGGYVESDDQADLSRIRFRKTLCRACFTAEKKK